MPHVVKHRAVTYRSHRPSVYLGAPRARTAFDYLLILGLATLIGLFLAWLAFTLITRAFAGGH